MSNKRAALKNVNGKSDVRNKNHSLLIGAVIAFAVIAAVWFGLADLSVHARLAFITFSLAVLGWVFTKISDTYIALAAAITFTLAGIDEPDEFFETLGDSTIWLLLASFIIAAGVTASGLSSRLTLAVAGRAKTVNQLFFLLTGAILVSAFVIPATSGRAALMVPIFLALSATVKDEKIVKALALLFPTIILLSAVASLIGAGAHLVTAEILWKMGGEQIGFAEWLMLGLPFAVASCLISVLIILFVFLNREERSRRLNFTPEQLAVKPENAADKTDAGGEISNSGNARAPQKSLSRREKYILAVVALLIMFWSTQSLHGINNTVVAIVGALAVTMPRFGVIDYKEGLKAVNWNMILFMAATLELGEALIESKAAEWLVQKAFVVLQGGWTSSTWFVVAVVAVVSLLSHLLITSRTARSSVLIPLVILLAVSLGYNPTTLAFLSTAAAGYCLTLPVSAKPVAMFNQIEGSATYAAKDLLRLSGFLLPAHLGLLLLFTFFVWPGMGLTLQHQTPLQPPPAPNWYENLPRNPVLTKQASENEPRPTATPWAVFGEYSKEENRRLTLSGTEQNPQTAPTENENSVPQPSAQAGDSPSNRTIQTPVAVPRDQTDGDNRVIRQSAPARTPNRDDDNDDNPHPSTRQTKTPQPSNEDDDDNDERPSSTPDKDRGDDGDGWFYSYSTLCRNVKDCCFCGYPVFGLSALLKFY